MQIADVTIQQPCRRKAAAGSTSGLAEIAGALLDAEYARTLETHGFERIEHGNLVNTYMRSSRERAARRSNTARRGRPSRRTSLPDAAEHDTPSGQRLPPHTRDAPSQARLLASIRDARRLHRPLLARANADQRSARLGSTSSSSPSASRQTQRAIRRTRAAGEEAAEETPLALGPPQA